MVSLYFGREVRTRLGVAFFEVYGPPVFHIKLSALLSALPKDVKCVPLSALPKDTTSELAGLFSTTSPKCRTPRREAADAII